jgi:SAM-dependent methyltransferase
VPLELVCPRDRSALREGVCERGHEYPIVDGIPILLVAEETPTHSACGEVEPLRKSAREGIDPFVQWAIGATCGHLYEHLIAELQEYPIPELRLPPGEGRTFLELGCNWGRWCVAATRRGYAATGIDPSLKGVQAARRVADQLGVEAEYVVGDARHLPFRDASVDVVFSYSVFHHFSKRDALAGFEEIGRVLKLGGESLIQMANLYGVKSLWNQVRERRFREPRTLFDVRYWGPRELQRELSGRIGPTELSVDGFFTLNPQLSDLALLLPRYRAVVRTSEALRRVSETVKPLTLVADSLYARSRRG